MFRLLPILGALRLNYLMTPEYCLDFLAVKKCRKFNVTLRVDTFIPIIKTKVLAMEWPTVNRLEQKRMRETGDLFNGVFPAWSK